jgi:hypothetical protein
VNDQGIMIGWGPVLVGGVAVAVFVAAFLGNWLGTWLGLRGLRKTLQDAARQDEEEALVPGQVPGFPRVPSQPIFDVGPEGDDVFDENLKQLQSRVK